MKRLEYNSVVGKIPTKRRRRIGETPAELKDYLNSLDKIERVKMSISSQMRRVSANSVRR